MTPEQVADIRARAQAAPGDLALQMQAAGACDRWGREEDAIEFYDRLYPRRGELSEDERWQFLVGYGSTLRNVKRCEESRAVLEAAMDEWPANTAYPAFLALTLLDLGESNRAVALLIDTLLGAGTDRPELVRYARALRYYCDELRG